MAKAEGIIEENIAAVRKRIREACRRAGRDESGVSLLCVTKTKPVSMLEEAYAAGERNFAENRVQELTAKLPQLPADIRWHMIGHLQKNKVKYLLPETGVVLIHSVDSLPLAEAIHREAEKSGRVMPILIEVNAAREESKFGVQPEEAEALIREIAPLSGVSVRGLMTIAPYTEDAESNRPYFRTIRELSVDIMRKCVDNVRMDVLSMGMTGDFEVAVEEGSTMVRVGTGIFGERYGGNHGSNGSSDQRDEN